MRRIRYEDFKVTFHTKLGDVYFVTVESPGGDPAADTIFSVENIIHAADHRGLPILPIGAAGGQAARVWRRFRDEAAGRYGGRLSGDDFDAIGPGNADLPEVARATIRLAAAWLKPGP